MMGEVDWGSVWSWMEAHGVAIGLGLTAVGAAFKAGMWWVKRRQRRDEEAAAATADRAREEDQLETTTVDFGRWACVPFGAGAGEVPRAAITIEVYDATVWIHSVRLSWRYRTDGDAWRVEGARCAPFDHARTFPIAVPMSDTLDLTWPEPRPPVQEAIEWHLAVEWGISRTGRTRVKRVGEGSTSWQEIPD